MIIHVVNSKSRNSERMASFANGAMYPPVLQRFVVVIIATVMSYLGLDRM